MRVEFEFEDEILAAKERKEHKELEIKSHVPFVIFALFCGQISCGSADDAARFSPQRLSVWKPQNPGFSFEPVTVDISQYRWITVNIGKKRFFFSPSKICLGDGGAGFPGPLALGRSELPSALPARCQLRRLRQHDAVLATSTESERAGPKKALRFSLRWADSAYTSDMTEIESNKLFRHLSPEELANLRGATREMTFAAEQPIFNQGDPGDGIYFVKDGSVQISVTVSTGESKVLSKIEPGDLFGEMAVLDSDPRSASAIAEKPTTVYFISRPELLILLDRVPRLAGALVRELSRRQRTFNDQYVREVFEAERLQLVGRFASSIVHDLKNPLNIIGISADMACMPSSTLESRQVAKVRIRKQVERISNMVNELLEFTQGAHTNFVLAQMTYKSFVEPLIEEIQQEVSLRSVKLEFATPAPTTMVRINPQRLSRVFHNLIGNAADAMPGGGTIKVRFSQTPQELVTELEDSGKGIPPQILDRLFQAFATFGKANGTGLGLSICKKIVQDHKGRISARNVPNGGAIFSFTLPLTPTESKSP